MENLCLWFSECQWNISVGHYEKLKNGHHFININCTEKFQITDPQNLGLRFSECQWKWNISIGHDKKIEKWPPFYKYQSHGKVLNYQPPKVWVSGFLSVDRNEISVLAIMKK